MKVTVTVTFLRSKRLGDNSLLLHFGCFSRGVKNFFSLITKHYLLFFWSNNNLSRRCVYLPYIQNYERQSNSILPPPQLGRPHYNIIRPSGGGG